MKKKWVYLNEAEWRLILYALNELRTSLINEGRYTDVADLTTALGWLYSDTLPITLANIMEKTINDEDFEHFSPILRHNEGVDLIPSSIELSGMEMALVNAMSREFTLRNYLDQIKHNYDYILIDCPPSLSMLTINAMAAADSVIVPVQAQYLPAKGMTQLMKTIGRVRKQINPSLKVDGVLLTLVDKRTNLARATAETLRQQYVSILKIYETQIPVAVKAAEISAAGKSIYAYDKRSQVAQAYAELTREVLADAERNKTKIILQQWCRILMERHPVNCLQKKVLIATNKYAVISG